MILSDQDRIKYIKSEWEKFLKKKNINQKSYQENISKAKTPKQLKEIVGVQASIKKAIEEDGILLSEEEIQLITKEILSRAIFDEESDYDSRLVRSYYKPSYFSHDVFDMIVNNCWNVCSNEHSFWETEFDDYIEKFEYKYEKAYSLGEVSHVEKSPSLFRIWQSNIDDE